MIACCVALVLLASCQTPAPDPARPPTFERRAAPHQAPTAQPAQKLQEIERSVRRLRDKNRDVQREIEKDAR